MLGDPTNRREYDDLYYVWRSSSEQLAVGLRERLNETRQRTRDEAAAWSRWAEQDRTTWEQEAKTEAQTGATGRRNEEAAADPTGATDESKRQRTDPCKRSDDWYVSLAIVITVIVVLIIGLFNLAYNN